jgi:parvulin-like peptidyl-prolyl isomerase
MAFAGRGNKQAKRSVPVTETGADQIDYIARFGTQIVTAADLLTELKYRSCWYLVRLALERKFIDELIDRYQIELTEDEVYEFMDTYREENDLYSEDEITKWLQLNNMDDDEFFEFCRHEASVKVLKKQIFSEEMQVENFAFRKLDMDAVELYHIVVPDLDLAHEIIEQTKEGATFFDMAHKFSIDEETRKTCGYMGLVRRGDLRAEIAGPVFGAKPGRVLGPFKGTSGYHLYLVDRIVPAELDEKTISDLLDEFFRVFLDSQIKSGEIDYQGSTSG